VTAGKIAIVIGSLEVGGAERQLVEIATRLDPARWHLDIIPLAGRAPLALPLEALGINVITPPGNALPRPMRAVAVAVWLWLWLLRFRPSIVHTILPEAYLVGGLAALAAGLQRVAMSRRSLNLYQRKRPALARLERWLHGRTALVVANSQAIATELRAEGVPADCLAVIHNGVDAERFCTDLAARRAVRDELGIASDALVLVIVANLIPYKGHDDLLQALAAKRDILPAGWRLLSIGRDDGIGSLLVGQADALGIAGNVVFLGPRGDVDLLLAASDIALSFSHEEGFPIAFL